MSMLYRASVVRQAINRVKHCLVGLMFLLSALPSLAANYIFPSNMPAGCSAVSTGNYSCGSISLAAGESIAIEAIPTTITFSGALNTGGSVLINNGGNTTNLTMVVNGAVNLGAGTILNGHLSTLGSGAVSIAVGSWISGNVKTETGFVDIGAATGQTGVGGDISTITGYIGLGAGAYVGGKVNTVTGYVSLGAGATINGPATTTKAGYVSLGAGAMLNGDIITGLAGSVILGANSWAKGSITVNGATGADYITTADSSKVNCNISSAGSYITLGASTKVGGSVTAKDYVTVGAGVYIAGNVTSTGNYVVVGDGSTVQGTVLAATTTTIDAGSHVYNKVIDTSGCGSTPSTSAASFECLASASALPARLFTKLAGIPFAFDVVALKTNGSIETGFVGIDAYGLPGPSKAVTVELVNSSIGSTCTAWSPLVTPVSLQLTFTNTDQGRKTLSGITSSNAYANLRCRVTDSNQTPSVVACSSDNFAVRPLNPTLTTTATAAAPSKLATPAFKAGTTFTLSAQNNPSYTGTLALDASKLTAQIPTQSDTQANGGAVGTLTPTSLVANSSAATATYSEVGYVYLAPGAYRDDTFTAVDSGAGDCITAAVDPVNYLSDTLVGSTGKYGCSIGNSATVSLGRFYPDHFVLTASAFAPGCGTFTYMGQQFTLSATIEAQNMAGAKTQNFAGVFAMATVVPQLDNANNGVALDKSRLTGQGSPAWASGAYPFVATRFSRSAVPDGAYDSLAIGLQVNSMDVALDSNTAPNLINRNMAETNPSCTSDSPGKNDGTCTASKVAENAQVRYGRIKLKNSYGSERLPLNMPIVFEYWTSNGWQNNLLDACSVALLSGSNFSFSFPSGTTAKPNNLLACNTALAVKGSSPSYVLQLSAPGSGKTGWANVALNMGTTPPGTQCQTAAVPSLAVDSVAVGLSWLQNTDSTVNPNARATFGIFKSPMIYRRENY